MVTGLFCFVGMDGSGKSTLARRVSNSLTTKTIPTKSIWWLSCEDSLFRIFLRKMMKGATPKNGGQTTKIERSLLIRLYIIAISLDYLRFGIVHISWPVRRSREVIILDRYYYDTIQAIDGEYPGNTNLLLMIQQIFSAFLPKPDRIFFIYVSPEESLRRKPDEIMTIENARELKQSYDEYLQKITTTLSDSIVCINNDQVIDIAEKLIETEIIKTIVGSKHD